MTDISYLSAGALLRIERTGSQFFSFYLKDTPGRSKVRAYTEVDLTLAQSFDIQEKLEGSDLAVPTDTFVHSAGLLNVLRQGGDHCRWYGQGTVRAQTPCQM